jgi:beta-phosphoglucomutase
VGLRAVIFDVDGVLVRSMESHAAAYQRVFAEIGVPIRPEEVFANEGRRSREVIQSLAEERGLGLSDAKLDEMNRRKQAAFYAFGPAPLYPGVVDLLDALDAHGIRYAAVTGTNRANVEHHLGPLVARFAAVVTSDDVTHTKPNPEPYQAALAKLAVKPQEAVVVENAVLGIRSAKAAGLRVVAVASTMPRDALRQADVVVRAIPEVWPALEAMH